MFLVDAEQIPVVINLVSHFSKASGLQLNLKKCELMALAESHLFNIPLKNEVKYLGIVITKDPKIREIRSNLIDNMKKSQNILNMWVQRDISIFGRILIQKSEELSRFIYPAFFFS